ncbi:MAG: 16S rRNA (uracil(1498)-N(3))-methyltransferase [Saprospiraceae bacterium]|nr:16S rRNA (uracil(1498)-N(3))-methyltransferase [Saprospiraceae bacterium]
MNLFYTPDITDDFYSLNEEESRHCKKVLRLKTGDSIHLTDGVGGLYEAEIIDDFSKQLKVKILKTINEFGKRDFRIHIAIAPTKNINRFEWFLEKATEIGIDEITPVICNHSERKVIKHERLNKVLTSAIKQSLKAYHPVLNSVTSFNDLVKKDFNGQKFIAHCEDNKKENLKNLYKFGNDVLVLIGPEGDFSSKEIQLAKKAGFIPISLGESRLRTETAGIVACHTVNLTNDV